MQHAYFKFYGDNKMKCEYDFYQVIALCEIFIKI